MKHNVKEKPFTMKHESHQREQTHGNLSLEVYKKPLLFQKELINL